MEGAYARAGGVSRVAVCRGMGTLVALGSTRARPPLGQALDL